jgi:hypothetical protein
LTFHVAGAARVGTAELMSALLLVSSSAAAASIQCGAATTQFAKSPSTLATAVQTGKLSFWWNWGVAPKVDTAGLPSAAVAGMQKAFVPMVWLGAVG